MALALALGGNAPRVASLAHRGAPVVPRNCEPLALLECGARTLLSLQPLEERRLGRGRRRARDGLARAPRGLTQLERIDGEPATATSTGAAFTAAGFVAGPKRLTLRARR